MSPLALLILALFQFIATMEILGLLVVQFQPRDEWSCATMRPGAPSVMTSGQPTMLMLPADSWDMLLAV